MKWSASHSCGKHLPDRMNPNRSHLLRKGWEKNMQKFQILYSVFSAQEIGYPIQKKDLVESKSCDHWTSGIMKQCKTTCVVVQLNPACSKECTLCGYFASRMPWMWAWHRKDPQTQVKLSHMRCQYQRTAPRTCRNHSEQTSERPPAH